MPSSGQTSRPIKEEGQCSGREMGVGLGKLDSDPSLTSVFLSDLCSSLNVSNETSLTESNCERTYVSKMPASISSKKNASHYMVGFEENWTKQ